MLKPRIAVIGVGGAGGNAVNNMIRTGLAGVNFLAANTDAQALAASVAEDRIQLGRTTTAGLGTGSDVELGRAAAEEATEEILEWMGGYNMVFVTAGMGGGTGTGGAPTIARVAREQHILTVGIVTMPFDFEGTERRRIAVAGIAELEPIVDTLIVIHNQNLFRIADAETTFANAFDMADQVLHSAVRGVTDLIILPGLVNLDFADIQVVMKETGKAIMGTGEASGERRALDAAEAALANPLLGETSIKGARGLLINIIGGPDLTLFEVDEATNRIRSEVGAECLTIFGSAFDQGMEGKIRVSVIATGIETGARARPKGKPKAVPAKPAPQPSGPALPEKKPASEPAPAAVAAVSASQPPAAAEERTPAPPPPSAEKPASKLDQAALTAAAASLAPADAKERTPAPLSAERPAPEPAPSPMAEESAKPDTPTAQPPGGESAAGFEESSVAATPPPSAVAAPASPGGSPAEAATDTTDPFLTAARKGIEGEEMPSSGNGDGDGFFRRMASLARRSRIFSSREEPDG